MAKFDPENRETEEILSFSVGFFYGENKFVSLQEAPGTFYKEGRFFYVESGYGPGLLPFHPNPETLPSYFQKGLLFRLCFSNFRKVVKKGNAFYIKLRSRPSFYKLKGSFDREKYWHKHPSFIESSGDLLVQDLLVHFYAVKLTFKAQPVKFHEFFEENCSKVPLVEVDFKQFRELDFSELRKLDWDKKYAVLCMLTHKLMKLEDINQETTELLLSEPNASCVLDEMLQSNKEFTQQSFQEVSNRQGNVDRYYKDKYRKVVLTSSSLVFKSPYLDSGNRITRKYKEFKNHFMRLNMADENLERAIWSNSSEILQRFKSYLKCFDVFGTTFEFLGFSSSQMRGHSCWMLSPDHSVSAESIRLKAGNFAEIKNVSKFAARLGLCFTSTVKATEVESVVEEPDITRNNYVFSDGIGKISKRVLDRIKASMNLEKEVCAFQIRFGGCKGVIALDPSLKSDIAVRSSMTKFKSEDRAIEVCNSANYNKAFLNRQIILLLSGLEVDDAVFLELQQRMENSLQSSLSDETKALEILENYSTQQKLEPVVELLKKGFALRQEEFVYRIMESLYKRCSQELREKAHIFAPESGLLMGVLDEYGVLDYGEVFVRIAHKQENRIIQGKVIVTKNPCLHPGDIRVLEAVDRPELHHLVNVVVFPQKGERPHPDEIAGSDLDGDLYFVSWNPGFLPKIENYPSMDYTAEPEKKNESISVEDVIDFFGDYMENENLGVICNAHLANADKKGVFHSDCLELAKLSSVSVDYPKTGVKAVMRPELKPKEYPDFMQKANSYPSEGILGKLFREASRTNLFGEVNFSVNQEFLVEGREKYRAMSGRLYNNYSKEIRSILTNFNIESEFDLLTGYVNTSKETWKYEVREKTGRLLSRIKNKLKWEVSKVSEEERKKLVSAMYELAYTGESRFISFPWMVYEYLI